MSNNYFRFKECCIIQDRCAMKVSTDACLQGAWTPLPAGTKTVLDIGCGTGLLSLMLAQRYPQLLLIDGIELDAAAAAQATENSAASPWHNRITIFQANARCFDPGRQYDFIICNPPFFIDSLHSPQPARNAARHTASLSQADLINGMNRLLQPHGSACFMWPPQAQVSWEKLLAQNGYYIVKKLCVKDKENAAPLREISICSKVQSPPAAQEQLSIHNADRSYTAQFEALLQPFYLKL